MIPFSTVIALDEKHLSEFRLTWPTWERFRPELLTQPLIVMYDDVRTAEWWQRQLDFCKHPNISLFPVYAPPDCASQREKMLTSFVLLAPKLVQTPWMLKLDVDAFSGKTDPRWCDDSLVLPVEGRDPVFVSNPWGYTKPVEFIPRLEEWADSVYGLKEFPRLNLIPNPGWSRLAHSRIISWCFFGNTEWCQFVASRSPLRLPVPSHDTYLWYWAARTQQAYRTVRMTHFGWGHLQGRNLKKVVNTIMTPETLPEPAPTPVPLPAPDGYVMNPVTPVGGRHYQHHPIWAQAISQLFPRVGIEIGVSQGFLSDYLLKIFPMMTLHLVDPWTTFDPSSLYHKSGDKEAHASKEVKDSQYEQTKTRLAWAGDRAVFHKQFSVEAAKSFEPGSLDWVFIDADHTYPAVKADIETWIEIVRPGGIIGGHDMGHPRDMRGVWGVTKAVKEAVAKYSLQLNLPGRSVWWAFKPL